MLASVIVDEDGAPFDCRSPIRTANVAAGRGYRMIETAEIKNFRAIEHVRLTNLRRLNLIVGDNGAGKTTLLEALFAATTNSAEIGSRFRLWRGLEQGGGSPYEVYDSLFASLFHNFDKDLVGSVSIMGSDYDTRQLRFFFDRQAQIPLPLSTSDAAISAATVQVSYPPVVFEFTSGEGKVERSTAQIQGNGIIITPTTIRPADSSFISARQPFLGSENARWFSDLSKRNKEKKLLASMRAQFPQITSLTVELDVGVPTVFAGIETLNRKVPINLISDGMTKVFTVLVHIAHVERTATFIDELENGLYFSRHEKLWPQLRETAIEYESQIFASTHSFEFIKAAVPTIRDHPDDFTLIRVYQKDGVSHAAMIPGQEALSLIEAGLEVRG
jgi:energy-coupling factor transporter ATP-binding protein EcfA2